MHSMARLVYYPHLKEHSLCRRIAEYENPSGLELPALFKANPIISSWRGAHSLSLPRNPIEEVAQHLQRIIFR